MSNRARVIIVSCTLAAACILSPAVPGFSASGANIAGTATTRAGAPTQRSATTAETAAAKRCAALKTRVKKARHWSAKRKKALAKKMKAACATKKQPTVPNPPERQPVPAPAPTDTARTLCTITDPRLREISGLASSQLHPSTVWTHNDSGDSARIFALNSDTCAVTAEVALSGVTARDFEAIGRGIDGLGHPVLWIADIGDNARNRTSVTLYRIPEPDTLRDQTVTPFTVTVTYADGARNAEGILVDPSPGGTVWIVSKEANGGIYQLSAGFGQSGTASATRIADVPSYLTDAALSPDGQTSVLRSGDFGQTRHGGVPGSSPATYTFPHQAQGEAVSYSADGSYLYIASEGVSDLIQIPVSEVH